MTAGGVCQRNTEDRLTSFLQQTLSPDGGDRASRNQRREGAPFGVFESVS